MIGHRKKFIFIHIPKTGGTSIHARLRKHGIVLHGERNFGSIYFKHITAMEAQKMMGDEFGRYFKFSVVRNPWDWVVSNYEFNRGLHQPFVKNTDFSVSSDVPTWAINTNFSEWLPWWIEQFNPSQSMMLFDENDNLLVDECYRFEALKKDSKRMFKRLGLFYGYRGLPHINKSQSKFTNFQEYYSEELYELVNRHFRKDITAFNYRF